MVKKILKILSLVLIFCCLGVGGFFAGKYWPEIKDFFTKQETIAEVADKPSQESEQTIPKENEENNVENNEENNQTEEPGENETPTPEEPQIDDNVLRDYFIPRSMSIPYVSYFGSSSSIIIPDQYGYGSEHYIEVYSTDENKTAYEKWYDDYFDRHGFYSCSFFINDVLSAAYSTDHTKLLSFSNGCSQEILENAEELKVYIQHDFVLKDGNYTIESLSHVYSRVVSPADILEIVFPVSLVDCYINDLFNFTNDDLVLDFSKCDNLDISRLYNLAMGFKFGMHDNVYYGTTILVNSETQQALNDYCVEHDYVDEFFLPTNVVCE